MTRRQYLAATGAAALAAASGGRAARASGHHPPGLPDQHVGHAHLLPAALGPAREARASSSRSSPCPPATSPCSRWWRARSTSAPMPAPPSSSATTRAASSASPSDRARRPHRARHGAQGPQPHARSSDLKGKKIANQTGSSIGNIFVDQIAPGAGLKKGDYQEVRMDVNDMVAAMVGQDRRRHGQRRALQRHRRGRRHRHHHHGLLERRQDAGVHGGDAGFRGQESGRHRRLSQGLARRRRASSRTTPTRWPTSSTASTPRKGYTCRRTPSARRWPPSTVNPGFPSDLTPYMQSEAEVLIEEKKIGAGLEQGPAPRIPGEGARQGRLKSLLLPHAEVLTLDLI